MQKYTRIVLVQWIVCAEVILYIGVCNSFSLGTELALRPAIIVGSRQKSQHTHLQKLQSWI